MGNPRITICRPQEVLTPREAEVMMWTAHGKTCAEIASVLLLSEETVRTHIKSSCQKLGATNKTHAVAVAIARELIEM